MRYLLILISIVIITESVRGQIDHELNFCYKLGVSTNSFRSTLHQSDPDLGEDLEWRRAHMLHESALAFEYKAEIWKKAKVFILGGTEIGRANFYIPIVNYQDYQVGDIDFVQQKMGYYFGFAKRLEFYDSKVKLDIGYRIKDLYPFQKNFSVASDWSRSENRDWIEYRYSLDVYYRQRLGYTGNRYFYYTFLRGEPFVSVQFSLFDNWFLNIQASYQRNNYFFYQYSYNIRYYIGGSPTPNGFEDFLGSSDEFFENNDLIYTTVGITYRFKNENSKVTSE